MQQAQAALRLLTGARVLPGTAWPAVPLNCSRFARQWHSEVSSQSRGQPQPQQQQQQQRQQPLIQHSGICSDAELQQQIVYSQHCDQQQVHDAMQQQTSVQQQRQLQHMQGTDLLRTFSKNSSTASSHSRLWPEQQQQQQQWRAINTQSGEPPSKAHLSAGLESVGPNKQVDDLLQVLLHPMPRTARWNSQLSPYLLQVNDQLLLQPSAVLMSLVRALHVLRGVLQENGQVYIVENNQLLRPLVKTAALSCINPNVWFDHRTWSPGTLTNYASSKRLFKESHQPNRRLFAAKGLRMVNPLLPRDADTGKIGPPPPLQTPMPRLSHEDKWLLYRRTRRPGFSQLLLDLLEAEDKLHRFKPAGSLKGAPQDLQLMIFLDSTRNAVALKEAYNKNIPTIAIVNASKDMSQVTYPVLGRDFSPAFVHFFLDWIIKVANTPVQEAA